MNSAINRGTRRYRKGELLAYTPQQTERLRMAYLMKGGFVNHLKPELDPTDAWRLRALRVRKIDWGLLRTKTQRGRKPHQRVQVDCAYAGCVRYLIAKGKTNDDALRQAWEKGWGFVEDLSFCRKHKLGRPDGKWEKGMVVHQREYGEIYTVEEYKPRGDHPLNFSSWPELWCVDESGKDKVFIFWQEKPPVALAIISNTGKKHDHH